MAELLQRQVFFPGTDSVSQIKIICAKLGTPIEEDILFVNSSAAQRFLRSLKGERKCLRYHFPLYNDDIHAMELLEATLKFNPHNRITATRALQSNFFNIYREEILEEPDFDFSSYCTDESLDQNILQDLVWAELRELHNDLPLAQGRMTMQTDTDIELDDYSDTDSHPPCHIVGFKSHNDFASKVIMTSQKRMRSAATGIGFKVKKRTGNGSYSYSPGSLINFLKQSTKDIDDANSIAEEAVEVDNYRSSFSSTLSGGASDDENSFCYVDGDKYGDTSFILPPLPIVAHHLVDITNPFSSFAKRNQSIKNNFGL